MSTNPDLNLLDSAQRRLAKLLLSLVPPDGTAIDNLALRREMETRLATEGIQLSEDDYWQVLTALIAQSLLIKGQEHNNSVRLGTTIKATTSDTSETACDLADDIDGFTLQPQVASPTMPQSGKPKTAASLSEKSSAPRNRAVDNGIAQIISYRHSDKRMNNPEVGMVTPATDPDAGKTRWSYDPHLDPVLSFDSQRARVEALIDDALASNDTERMRAALEELKRLQSPYLNWAGKAERTSFEIDTVSLHVHERIDPASILSAIRKAMKGESKSKGKEKAIQPGLFDAPFENLPLRDAIDFYRHERGWANRLITGDSLLVMNSLLQKESMAGRVQMIYIDPPYGIKYGSNFQPFVGKRDVKDRSDADLTQEPEMIKAFRDTWELGIHSYLTYLRDRLLLARELLHESGSVFVQISDENVHLLRDLMDEIFGTENFCSLIYFATTTGQASMLLPSAGDYIVWYAKNRNEIKYRQLFHDKASGDLASYSNARSLSDLM